MFRFYEPVNFQPNILPVCVPHTDEGFVGKTAYVTGWGRLYEGIKVLYLLINILIIQNIKVSIKKVLFQNTFLWSSD